MVGTSRTSRPGVPARACADSSEKNPALDPRIQGQPLAFVLDLGHRTQLPIEGFEFGVDRLDFALLGALSSTRTRA
jgi:hypothetical protein